MDDPATLVGSDRYLDRLETDVDRGRFPDPDPDLVPTLTEARYVARAARETDAPEFADAVEALRDPVFDPLVAFDFVAVAVDADDAEVPDPVETAGLDRNPLDGVDLDQDPQDIFAAALDSRELTFLDYPAPPHHFVEAAENRGQERLGDPDEFWSGVEGIDEEYLADRYTVETVVAGARDLGTQVYENEASVALVERSGVAYESPEHYGRVVAFNAGLAAESMLEAGGEIVYPP